MGLVTARSMQFSAHDHDRWAILLARHRHTANGIDLLRFLSQCAAVTAPTDQAVGDDSAGDALLIADLLPDDGVADDVDDRDELNEAA